MGAPLLSQATLCFTPVVLLCIFNIVYSDDYWIKSVDLVAGSVVFFGVAGLLFMASRITAKAVRINWDLHTGYARHGHQSWTVQQRQWVLEVIEGSAAMRSPIVIYTWVKEVITKGGTAIFMIDQAFNYLNLVSLQDQLLVGDAP